MNSIQGLNIEYDNKIKRCFIIMISNFSTSILIFLIYYFLAPKLEIFTLVSFVCMMISFIHLLTIHTLKSEKKLLNRKLEKLEPTDQKEFDNIILYCRDEYIFTKNKVFLLKDDVSFEYKDIILIYTKFNILRALKIGNMYSDYYDTYVRNQSLIVILKTGKAIRLSYDVKRIYYYSGNYSTLEALLLSQNREILIGNTEENFEKIEKEYSSIDREKLKYFG